MKAFTLKSHLNIYLQGGGGGGGYPEFGSNLTLTLSNSDAEIKT